MPAVVWVALSGIAELFTGYPFRAGVRPEPGGEIPVLQLQDVIHLDAVLPESVVRVSNRDGKYGRYLLKPGDLLFQARGFRHPAGVVTLSHPAISVPGLHVIRPNQTKVLSQYLQWCINHPRIQAAIAEVAQGTHAPFVSKQSLAKVRIPLPSIVTQERIADVHRLRENERQLAAQLSQAQDSLVDSETWQAALGVSA